jgi:flagellar motor switch protein FliG
LLLYLGNEVTAKVYEHMDDSEIKKISKSMGALGHVSRETIMGVVSDFTTVIDPESGIFSQGDEFVFKILEKALGPEKAKLLMDELQASSYGDLVDILSNMDSIFFLRNIPRLLQ